MKVVPLEGMRLTVPELVELARDEAVVLTLGGQPLATVRDVSGSDWESASLASNPQFMARIDRARQGYRDQGGIRLEQLRRELALDSHPESDGPSD